MGLRVEQGIRRSTKRILRLVPYESPAFRHGENVNSLNSLPVIRDGARLIRGRRSSQSRRDRRNKHG